MKRSNLHSYALSQNFIDFTMGTSKLVLSEKMYFPLFAPSFRNYMHLTSKIMGNT